MLPIETVRDKIRHRCSQLRAVQRISETKDFETAFAKADDALRAKLILISTAKEMRVWMALATQSPLSALSYRKLRDMAKGASVFNYSRLDRASLIKELESRRARKLEPSKEPDRGTQAVSTDVRGAGASSHPAGS